MEIMSYIRITLLSLPLLIVVHNTQAILAQIFHYLTDDMLKLMEMLLLQQMAVVLCQAMMVFAVHPFPNVVLEPRNSNLLQQVLAVHLFLEAK